MPERKLTDIEILKRIDEAKAKSIGVSRGYTRSQNVATALLTQARLLRTPLASVVFTNPTLTYLFAAVSGDWTWYGDDLGDGDSIAFGAGGFTITNKASAMMEFPEFNGYSREISMLYGEEITVIGLSSSNVLATTLRDYGVLSFRHTYQEYNYGNMGDVHEGEFLIRCNLTGVGNKWQLTAARYGLADTVVNTGIGIANTIDLHVIYNNGILTLAYRQTGGGAWTTLTSEVYTLTPGYITLASGKPSFGHGDETFGVQSLVTYDTDASCAYDGFIPSISYNGLNKDSIYLKLSDSGWYELVPVVNDIVLDITSGVLYQWNGTTWVIYTHVLATDTALGSMHTITGGVLGALLRASDATHANFQRITINQPNDLGGVAGAVTDNFFSADANDLPKDSGSNSGSFISSTLSGTTKQVVTKQAAGTWAAENPQQYHKVNASTVLAMIMTEE